MSAFLLLALLGATLPIQPASAEEVELNVRYSRPVPMYQGHSYNITLYIRNLDSSRPINVTWTGVHIDWLEVDIFHVNETVVRIAPGAEARIDIEIEVPQNAKVGNHTESFNIEYDAYEGRDLPWGHYNWESVPVKDLKVATKSTGPTTSEPCQSFFDNIFDTLLDEPMCLVGTVLFCFFLVVGIATAAARRLSRSRRRSVAPAPVPREETLRPAPAAPPPMPAPAPAPPASVPPQAPVPTCPFCGAPNPGEVCRGCGWKLG